MGAVEQVETQHPPDYMVAVIEAHDRFLREAYAFFASLKVERVDGDGYPKPGTVIPYVLFAKLIQLGRAVHRLVATGYTEEAEPVARAMVSAALNLVGIADADSDARALRFIEQQRELRAQLMQGYIDEGYMTADDAAALDKEWRAQEDAIFRHFGEKGVVPARIEGANPFTWHGLSDKKLATKMKASRWYNLYYRNFSDEAHANVASVASAVRMLNEERKIHVGPKFKDPWMLMFASGDTIGECLGQLDTLYSAGRRAEVEAINERFGEALKKHRAAMPAPVETPGRDPAEAR